MCSLRNVLYYTSHKLSHQCKCQFSYNLKMSELVIKSRNAKFGVDESGSFNLSLFCVFKIVLTIVIMIKKNKTKPLKVIQTLTMSIIKWAVKYFTRKQNYKQTIM